MIEKLLIGGLVGFINGFFASGGGIVAVLALERLQKLDEKKAHATAVFVIFPLTIVSLLIYHRQGFGAMSAALSAGAGSVFGAFIGAVLLSRLKKEYIRALFGIIMIIAAIKMFF